MNLKNKKIVVVGLARSGIAAARFLSKEGALVKIIDKSKSIEASEEIDELSKLGVKFKTGKHEKKDFHKAELIVLSPGVSHKIKAIEVAKKQGIPVVGEIELASIFINKPIIGVTGTNGKTTTVKLIEKMLINSSKKVFLGGNTGIALTECIDHLKNIEIVIAEISSFQLDTIKTFKPRVSILLNISTDHMDRYQNFRDYASSKLKIFSNQTKSDIAILNKTDNNIKNIINSINLESQQKLFSNKPVENGAQIFNKSIVIFENKVPTFSFDLSKSKLKGYHNQENIAAAAIAALAEGGNTTGIQSAIDNFKAPSHRIETIKTIRGITFVNDSKATNVHATASALASINKPIILILGGRSKKSNFKYLIPYLWNKVKTIIAMGEARNQIKLELSSSIGVKRIMTVTTLEDAIMKAIGSAKAGYIVLLSPACSSFDQFKNYEHRGQRFKEIIKSIE